MSLAAAATVSSNTITSSYELEHDVPSGEAQITMSDPDDVPFNVSSGLKEHPDET